MIRKNGEFVEAPIFETKRMSGALTFLNFSL